MYILKNILYSSCALLLALEVSAQNKTTPKSALTTNSSSLFTKKAALTDKELNRWSHLDLATDTIPGMSVDKAYAELLQGKKGSNVIVGVVDSGVDIEHEDLKSVVWTNAKEIAGNGIDDDKNGYIDDIHGWNFLGDAVSENLEMTRIVKKGDDGSETYKKAKLEYDAKLAEALEGKQQIDFLMKANQSIETYLKKDSYSIEDLKKIETTDVELNKYKMIMTQIAERSGPDFKESLLDYKKYLDDQLNYHLNKDFDGRKILKNDAEDLSAVSYGNNIVFGPDKEEAMHGTHVSGIIAQVRNNNLGGDGIANNVSIMAVRAVPNGDEYDKDIALAIRYAVDNGAKVINGSFGKSYSPHKEWVYDAIKYAAKKDVLIVHAAGNDAMNIDLDQNSNFPNDAKKNQKEFANNLLTIGALNFVYGQKVIAPFSNYGKINVDIYAPGMEIYATVPNGKYKMEQGTSMASPNVAGVAALIRSYYPKLKASQVKQIILQSGLALPSTVELGEKEELKSVVETSKTGKMVNAYNALLLAEQMSKK